MAIFEMVKYHSQNYPDDIPLHAEECAAHFDITSVSASLALSLHTEYSYGKRRFESNIIQQFPTVMAAQKSGVPQLWKSEQWASEFAQFIFILSAERTPAVIEIHPPFSDYSSFDSFLASYRVFEDMVLSRFPDVSILIENRCGSVYKDGKFLVSKYHEIETLCNLIVQHNLRLKIAYDIPQIYTAHNTKTLALYLDLLQRTEDIREQIGGVHLWGKRRSKTGRLVAHCGDLNSYFGHHQVTKKGFLAQFNQCFNDGIVRKMVLEVNSSNDDLLSIVADLKEGGVIFV